jgi:hypothetical protein
VRAVRPNLVNGVAATSRRRGLAKDNFATMWSISGDRTSPAKETAMPTRRFERITLAQLLLSGCAVVFGACVLIEQARAQYVPPPTPLPPPVFNPSSPYTVPQPSYRPIAPATPSAAPGYVVTSPPVSGRPTRTVARSHRRTSVAKTRSAHHPARSVIVRPGPESYSSYYLPFGYGYGCSWRRGWDGYWFRTSPCS